MENDTGTEAMSLKIENKNKDEMSSEMTINQSGIESLRFEIESKKLLELYVGSKFVFAREGTLYVEDFGMSKVNGYGANKQDSNAENAKILSLPDRFNMGQLFQTALSYLDWDFAERLILFADPPTLNDFLCISLDLVWFLHTHEDLHGITGLIKKIIANGAYGFVRAILQTSFFASCVSTCRSQTMSFTDTLYVMTLRWHERVKERICDDELGEVAKYKVQKFMCWAMKCNVFHSVLCHGNMGKLHHDSAPDIALQLSVYKTFFDLAGNNLSQNDFIEAFDAACWPLTLFSSSLDPSWSSGASAVIMEGLLGMLVEYGADNADKCLLEATCFGSTDLIRILLKIAQRNNLDIDVDLALYFASHFSKMSLMECLVEEGNSTAFAKPLNKASERGCLPVVRWFVDRGCEDGDLCVALTTATSNSQVEVIAYLLPHLPLDLLGEISTHLIKIAGEQSRGSLEGVAFLLRSNFLRDPEETYLVADEIATEEDDSVTPELRTFLRDHWSDAAFTKGLLEGEEHFLNLVRVFERGESPLCLGDLPGPLRVAIAYLPLYRECLKDGDGCLLSQRLRGRLVEAVNRLEGEIAGESDESRWLLGILGHHLKPFFT